MRILYLITGLGMGGAEKVVCSLADNMYLKGHKVTLVYMVGKPIVKPHSKDVEIIFLDFRKNPLVAFLKFLKILKRMKPDVVHSNMFHANIFSRISRLFVKFPKLISSSHSDNEGGRLRMLAYFLTDHLSTISTNVSQNAKNKLVEQGAVPESKMVVMHNSIDTKKFSFNLEERGAYRKLFKLAETDICMLAVGRFHPAKDYSTLINVFSKIKKNTNKNVKLFIVGDGELRKEIENQIYELGLEQSITLLGIRDDVVGLMNMCDLFISTSAWEGFGLVLAEAMSCSRVVVASRNAGFSEILGAESEFLVKVGDVDAFSSLIEQIMSWRQEDFIRIQQQNCQRIEQYFANEKMMDKWIALYEK